MSKLVWKPGALLSPVPPALVTCGTLEAPNLLTIAWTGIVNTRPAMTYISVRPGRFSYPLICQSGEFVINLTTQELVPAADFCGVRSGREVDKFEAMRLTPEAAVHVGAPLIKESPVNLECRVTQIVELGSHHMFLGEVLGVDVDERYLDQNQKLHLERAGLIVYSHGQYFTLGKNIGRFGFSVRKR